jgi:Ribonuclease G/E
MAAARSAFGPDNPGVAIGPVGRFGTMELSLPRRSRPLMELLCREDGAPSDRALAQRLIRRLEAEAAADPGGRLVATCAPDVARAVAPLVATLSARMGSRFTVAEDAARPRERFEVGPAR